MNYALLANAVIPIIWVFAGIALTCLVITGIKAMEIDRQTGKANKSDQIKRLFYWADILYTMFITIISIFPLLGMLGTVLSLLALDISGDTEPLKENFFTALETTGLGIVLAVVFKVINAFVQPYLETQISKARQLLEKSYDKGTES